MQRKIRYFLLLLPLVMLAALTANGQTILWADEFDKTRLDDNKWTREVGGGGFGNGELQYYTSGEQNVYIGSKTDPADTGYLVIEARRESYGVAPERREFTSGRINTAGKFNFMYGMIEARIKLPDLQNGLWPAFWMLGANYAEDGWPASGEIDILEAGFQEDWQNNRANKVVHSTVHWFQDNYLDLVPDAHAQGWYGNASASNDTTIAGTVNDGYHTYTMEWTPEHLKGYVDGIHFYTFENPADDPNITEFREHPYFLLLNLAIGGGNFVGITDPANITAPMPAKMEVDYVRVYSNEFTSESFFAQDLPRETGTFGVFTETHPTDASLGSTPEIEVWNNSLEASTSAPQEGSNVLSFTAAPGDWFGLGIPTAEVKNMQNFIDGTLHFHMKTTSDHTFSIGVSSTFNGNAQGGTQTKTVDLSVDGNQFGLQRDGQWHEVVIPISMFGNVEFRSINNMFYLVGDAPATSVDFAIDNIYWVDGTKVTPEYGDFVLFSDTQSGVENFELGSDGDIYVWENTLAEQPTTAFEGSNVLSYTHNNMGWFGMAFTPNQVYNLSAFNNPNAKLNIALKTSDNAATFHLGMKSGTRDGEGQKWISFEPGNDPYGFQRNGSWQLIEIPMSDLAEGVDLMQVTQLFQIVGTSNISDLAIDHIYFSGGTSASDEEENSGGSGFPVPGTIQAEDYSSMNGIQLEGTSDSGGGENVGWIDAGDWMDYEVNVASAGTYTVEFRVASAGGGGALELQAAGQTLASESVPSTGGWQSWTTISGSVNLAAGTQTLRVYAASGGWNLNWIAFSADNTNEAPSVSLTAPATGSSFTAPATINISANASDSHGSISAVAFYNGEHLLATDNSSPYSYSWTGVAPGSYSITARATDNSGAVTTSSAVAITVEAAPSGTDITDLGGSISVQFNDSPAGEGFNNLIDNNSQTKYLTFNSSAWVQYQAPGSYIVDSYTISSANDAPERDPLSWTLQGSADGSSWTTIDSRSGEDFPSRYQTRTFSFSNSQAYTYFRLNLNNNSGTMLQLAEIELFGTEDAISGGDGFPVPGIIQAEDYSSMNGIQLEGTSDTGGGQNVGWIEAGDWMDYEVNVASAGTYTVEFRVASAGGGGALELQAAGQTLASESVPSTGGWQSWTTISGSVNLAAGTQTLRVYAAAGGWNLNWIEFTEAGISGGGACSFEAATGDYTAEVSADAENPGITFVPSRSGVGSSTVILYYGSSATDALPGYTASANQPFQINAKQGQTIYFYYTYNVPEGGERNTSASRHSFTVGNCSAASARMSSQDSFKEEEHPGGFNLYPNPVKHELNIPAIHVLKGARIQILDAAGRSVYQGSLSSGKVDISTLNPGVYSISIQQGNVHMHKRFIKE